MLFRYELSVALQEACSTLATYLIDSTTIQTKQLVSVYVFVCVFVCVYFCESVIVSFDVYLYVCLDVCVYICVWIRKTT